MQFRLRSVGFIALLCTLVFLAISVDAKRYNPRRYQKKVVPTHHRIPPLPKHTSKAFRTLVKAFQSKKQSSMRTALYKWSLTPGAASERSLLAPYAASALRMLRRQLVNKRAKSKRRKLRRGRINWLEKDLLNQIPCHAFHRDLANELLWIVGHRSHIGYHIRKPEPWNMSGCCLAKMGPKARALLAQHAKANQKLKRRLAILRCRRRVIRKWSKRFRPPPYMKSLHHLRKTSALLASSKLARATKVTLAKVATQCKLRNRVTKGVNYLSRFRLYCIARFSQKFYQGRFRTWRRGWRGQLYLGERDGILFVRNYTCPRCRVIMGWGAIAVPSVATNYELLQLQRRLKLPTSRALRSIKAWKAVFKVIYAFNRAPKGQKAKFLNHKDPIIRGYVKNALQKHFGKIRP